jgi:hypothetical protein
MGSIPSSLFFRYSDPWITRRERELGSKLQFALDPSSQISSDPTQASLLITKLGSMDQKKRERAWLGSDDEI